MLSPKNNKLQIFFIMLIVSQGIHGQQQLSYISDAGVGSHAAAPAWNYDNDGTDWAESYSNCNGSVFKQQSPFTLNISDPKVTDWSKQQFAFVPYFSPAKIASVSTDNLVFTIDIAEDPTGKFIGIQAVEPQIGIHHFVKWHTASMQFHYPAEHPWTVVKQDGSNNTVTAALELQIYGKVSKRFSLSNNFLTGSKWPLDHLQ